MDEMELLRSRRIDFDPPTDGEARVLAYLMERLSTRGGVREGEEAAPDFVVDGAGPLTPHRLRRRIPGPALALMVALAVVTVGLLTRALVLPLGDVAAPPSPEDATSPEPADPTIAPSPSSPESTASTALAVLGDRLYEQPGDRGLGPIIGSGEELTVVGWRMVLSSTDGGESWQLVGGPPQDEEALVAAASGDGVLVAIGARDGAGARLYRSEDQGASWELQDLPARAGTVRVVPHVISYQDSGFLVAGVGTTGSFDTDVTIYLWSSPDGRNWEFEPVADMGAEFTYIDSVELIEDAVVLLSQTGDDSARRLLAFERPEGADAWSQVDLTPIVQDQGGISPELVNIHLNGAGTLDGDLLAWWSFDRGMEDEPERAAVVTRRTARGAWEASPIRGIAPETVTSIGDGFLVGTSYQGEMTPYIEPRFTAIVSSVDGISWEEIGRFQGIALGRLRETTPNLLLASGKEVEAEGFGQVASSGIWKVELTIDHP